MKLYEKSVIRNINKISNKIRRKMNGFTACRELSGAQGRALHFILAQPDGIFQKDIEEEFDLRPPTASELLKKMELNGFIQREAVTYDARLKKIISTEKAMQYIGQVTEDLDCLEREATGGISKKELETFFEVSEKILENLS